MPVQSAECANIPAVARWKDDEERGDFGAWLTAAVGPERTFDWLAAEMAARGHAHGADYYRAMAAGNKPPGRIIGRALREFFGNGPTQKETGPSPIGEAGLAKAISELALELGKWRQERESFEVRIRALEAELESRRAPLEGGASGGPLAPQVEAGSGR